MNNKTIVILATVIITTIIISILIIDLNKQRGFCIDNGFEGTDEKDSFYCEKVVNDTIIRKEYDRCENGFCFVEEER